MKPLRFLFIVTFFVAICSLSAQDDATLIDVTNLEQLDAIRYDLDGDGLPSSSGEAAWESAFGDDVTADTDDATHSGSNIVGYELTADLDFNGTKWGSDCSSNCLEAAGTEGGTEASVGWNPIGDLSNQFLGTFHGNGHTISNIFIDRDIAYVGLFGVIGADGEVRNLGIEGGSVKGQSISSLSVSVAPLVGTLTGTVRVCYATASAEATGAGILYVGGLVGLVSGGTITTCYATGTVTGTATSDLLYCGGLVGYCQGGGVVVSNCYATGNATADGTNVVAGGLIGRAVTGSITASYATGEASGTATGTAEVGGLVGSVGATTTVTGSYFDYEVSNRPSSDDHAQSTHALQSITRYTGLFEAWDDQEQWVMDGPEHYLWSVCGEDQYPKLSVDFDGDGTPSVGEFGAQGPCTSSFARIIDLETAGTAQDTKITELETGQTTHGTKLTELEAAGTAQDTKITELETGQTEHGTKLTELETGQSDLETSQTAQDTKLTELETAGAAQDTKITALETAKTELETGQTDLETAGTAQDTKITALETNRDEQDTKITALETAKTELETAQAAIQAKIAAFEAALTAAGVDIPDPPTGGTPGGGTPGTTPPTGGTPGTTPPSTTTIYSVPATSGAPQAYPNPAHTYATFRKPHARKHICV